MVIPNAKISVKRRSRNSIARLPGWNSSVETWTHKFVPSCFSLSVLESLTGSESVIKLQEIIRSPDIGSQKFSSQFGGLKKSRDHSSEKAQALVICMYLA